MRNLVVPLSAAEMHRCICTKIDRHKREEGGGAVVWMSGFRE